MSYSGVEHKLRVFISSKCGGKYTIARKALKNLLEVTGFVEAYVFETEPGSSEDTVSAYLEYVDNSNLCIFLIDNADGVRPAVLSEEKRAKDKSLRLLYIFCDENQKEPTSMQEEIKISSSQKYMVVHEFSDVVKSAYDSVMQDIIAVYKRKDKLSIDTENEQGDNFNFAQQSITDAYSMSKKRYPSFPLTSKILAGDLFIDNPFKEKSPITDLDRLLSVHLKFILRKTSYDENAFLDLRNEILKVHDASVQKLIRKRFDAQDSYYNLNYDESITRLQDALEIAVHENEVPEWIANDIAIDIRHVYELICEQESGISMYNPGQEYIEKSIEPVYFPYLDRQVANMQEEISKKYYTQLNISPYTTTYGGLNALFSPLANAFCIAEINASIVQTEITRVRLISIYLMLSTLYEDHDVLLELIRLLIVNRETKKLDTIIRTRSQAIEMMNSTDISRILESVETISDTTYRVMSKYLLASQFGPYMDDQLYSHLCDELVDFALVWANDDNNDNRIFNYSKYIFDFFRMNTLRADVIKTIDFIVTIFEKKSSRFYDECFKIISEMDFAKVPDNYQRRIRQLFADISAKRIICSENQFLESAIIRFCKSATIPYKRLEKSISKSSPAFYEKTFKLEMASFRNEDSTQFIDSYLAEARSRNETQGVNGSYSGYAHESYDVIYNIITFDEIKLDPNMLHRILNSIVSTLELSSQTVRSKNAAVRLMQFLYFQYNQDKIWDVLKPQLIDNMLLYTTGYETSFFDKANNNILSFAYSLFICNFNEIYVDAVLEKLFSLDAGDSYDVIQFLRIIADYLENGHEYSLKKDMLSAFLYFSLEMSLHKESDVKYYATRCLIELTNFETTKGLALKHLSQIMDKGSQSEKNRYYYENS